MGAIELRNAWKSYGGTSVLKGLSMTVPSGNIYGLLGASGCGKTTVLACIVGTKRVDRGSVLVLGDHPQLESVGQKIGYMPQDTALYEKLTIGETFEYFGFLYGLSKDEILDRMKSHLAFLDLPHSSTLVSVLSGGQKRRTSLGIALLNQAPILILDEPTVGVDPLLREKIWDYLTVLVKESKRTVLITTHYIEEARHANVVGLIRNGDLIVEKCPRVLLTEFNTTLLEDIVLTLCKNNITEDEERDEGQTGGLRVSPIIKLQKDEPILALRYDNREDRETRRYSDFNWNSKAILDLKNNSETSKRKSSYLINNKRNHPFPNLTHVQAVITVNALFFLRNPMLLVVVILLGPLNILAILLVMGSPPHSLNFGVVTPTGTNTTFSNCLSSTNECDSISRLDCRFLNAIPPKRINLVSIPSREAAVESVRAGRTWGYFEIPTDYSRHSFNRFVEGLYASNDTLLGSTVAVKMDQSHYLVTIFLLQTIYQSFQEYTRGTLEACGDFSKKSELPFKFKDPIYGIHADLTGATFSMIGGLFLILFFVPHVPGLLNSIEDRNKGTLERSRIAGATPTESLIGKLILDVIIVFIPSLIAYLQLVYFHEIKIQGSHATFFTFLMITGLAGVMFGTTSSVVFDQQFYAVIWGVACLISAIMACGVIWPTESYGPWLKVISFSTPLTWPIDSLRSVTFRGWGLSHPKVWPGMAVLLIWIALFSIIFLIVRRWRKLP